MTRKKIIITVVALLAVCLQFSGCEFPTVGIGDLPSPQGTVEEFFDSICTGNLDKANTYLLNSSVSMDGETSGEFADELLGYLRASYDYKLVGDAEVNGLYATQKVVFTYLDPNILAEDLREQSTKVGQKYINTRDENYTTIEDGKCALTDEGAEQAAIEALEILMQTPEKYYNEKGFDIQLQYTQKAWHIELSDELFNAIVGKYSVAE